jgi:hypothetical protein
VPFLHGLAKCAEVIEGRVMVRINQVDSSLMDKPKTGRGRARELTPAQRERERQQRQLVRMLSRLDSPQTVFEVRLSADDKPVTIRQRLLRAAQDAGKEIAVRKSANGFLVGLMTPERKSNRGRKKQSA